MKKFFLVVAILIVVILTATMQFRPTNTNTRTEVTFWTLQMGDFSGYINGLITEFEAQNPEIKIKWIDVPFSEGEKRTLASVLSDNPPDLINLNPDFSALLAQKGALYEIDTALTKDFNQEIINALKYNNKLYLIPWYATSAVTIYNKKLLKNAGVTLPQTYEQLAEISPQIRKTGVYSILPNITENDTMLRILNKYGVNSPNNINSLQAVEVFDFFKHLYEKDLIPKETITQTHREALEKYMAEQTVFFQSGANFLNMIKENAPSTYKNTDVAPQITGKFGQYDFSLMNFVIPLKALHKKEALKFALFITNQKNQLELAKLTNVLATNEKALQDEFYKTYSSENLQAKARVISAKQLMHINPAFKSGKNQKDVNTLINTAVQEALLNTSATQSILDSVAKNWKELISSNS